MLSPFLLESRQVVVVVDGADDEERVRVPVPQLLAELVQSLQHQGVGKVSHRCSGVLGGRDRIVLGD